MADRALSGYTFGVTAPNPADALARLLGEHGAECVHAPVEAGDSGSRRTHDGAAGRGLPENVAPAERLIRAISDRRVDAVTFTTRCAVENLIEIASRTTGDGPMLDALAIDVVAVCTDRDGAAALARRGVDPMVPPDPEPGAVVRFVAAQFDARSRRLDFGGHRVMLRGRLLTVDDQEPVRLTDREREVLRVLAERPGVVVSKRSMLRRVWGGGETDEHAVEVTVARLRQRLGTAGSGIETVIRRGYRLDVPP